MADHPKPDLQSWVGTRRSEEEWLSPAPARRMMALLDRDPEGLEEGDPLPPGWHWLYVVPPVRRSELAEDGHETRGGFLPPVPLPRRMWAGGRMRFLRPLEIGRRVRCTSTVTAVEAKEGRSGPLVFVTVRRELSVDGALAVEEERDLVYRERTRARSAPARGSEPPEHADWSETFRFDPVTLFRFSALTFNAHRIHYDHPYATEKEGYPGVVAHGPLLALLLLDAAARWGGLAPVTFSYRASSPVFCGEEVRIEGRGGAAGELGAAEVGGSRGSSVPPQSLELWIAHAERGVAMRATAGSGGR